MIEDYKEYIIKFVNGCDDLGFLRKVYTVIRVYERRKWDEERELQRRNKENDR